MRQLSAAMWKKIVLSGSGLLVVMVLLLVVLNSSVIPDRVSRSAVATFTRATGWDMDIGRVEFTGPTRVVLRDVEVSIPSDDAAYGWMSSVRSPGVHVSVNPFSLIFGRREAPVGSMTWTSPEVRLNVPLTHVLSLSTASGPMNSHASDSAPSGDRGTPKTPQGPAMRIAITDGKLTDPEGEWIVQADLEIGSGSEVGPASIKRVELSNGDNGVELELATSVQDAESRWQWKARGPASFVSDLLADVQFELTGEVQGSGSHRFGSSSGGEFEFYARSGDIRWGEGVDDQTVAFDELYLSGEYDNNLTIESLRLVRDDGVLEGHGSMDLARASLADAPMEIQVHTDQLRISESIPILYQLGLSGSARFNGLLTGSLAQPELTGRLGITAGTVWHRPVDRAEGVIFLNADRFTFGETVLEKGAATYRLNGQWLKGEDTAQLQITLDSERGRAEEVLAALGQDDMDVRGEFDGRLTLSGPVGALQVAGSVEGRDFDLYGQPVERLNGDFNWNEQTLHLQDVVASWRGGRIELFGSSYHDDLDFRIALDQWPLDLPMLAEHSAPREHVNGWVSYTGTISGTIDAPTTRGTVLDGEINIGEWSLRNPRGGLAVDGHRIAFDGLSVHAFGHGEYVLSGTLDGWTEDDPELNLRTDVREASLSALFNENGLTLPALLVDGVVDGTIVVDGPTSNPDARFDLALRDEFDVGGSPLRLRFQLVDGRLKFDGLSALLGVMNRLTS